jgi:hypothetical protein
METITQPVGVRNGATMMPNNQADLRTVTGLLVHRSVSPFYYLWLFAALAVWDERPDILWLPR